MLQYFHRDFNDDKGFYISEKPDLFLKFGSFGVPSQDFEFSFREPMREKYFFFNLENSVPKTITSYFIL